MEQTDSTSNDENDSLIEKVRKILLPTRRYHNIVPFEDERGAKRECFRAGFGQGNGCEQKVFIKVDKKPEGVAAHESADLNCNTPNELDIMFRLPVVEALSHGIAPISDFYDSDGMKILIMPEFENSMSLKRTVKREIQVGDKTESVVTPLNKSEFNSAFEGIIEASRYLIKDKGLVHRDLNPTNILLRRASGSKDNLETMIIDLENARDINEIKPDTKAVGARSIRDFALDSLFTDKPHVAPETAEAYSIGMNALLALLGDMPVRYDPYSGTAIELASGDSLLDSEGLVDVEKHNKAVDAAIARLPAWAKRHAKWIRKSIEGDVNKRYSSIDGLVNDFAKASAPTLRERISGLSKKAKVAIAAGAIGLSTLTGLVGNQYVKAEGARQQLEQERMQQNTESMYKSDFKSGYNELIRSFFNGGISFDGGATLKPINKIGLYADADKIKEVCKENNLDYKLVNAMYLVNETFASVSATGAETKGLTLLDPFRCGPMGDYDPESNLRNGAKRLSDLFDKYQVDRAALSKTLDVGYIFNPNGYPSGVVEALTEFYCAKKGYRGAGSNYESDKEEGSFTLTEGAREIVWNVLRGGPNCEGWGGMGYYYLDMPAKDFKLK